jgi:large subunit ribosomal protein L21
MYAIVEIAGQQYKVEKDQQIFVHRLEGEEGSKVSFDNVLLTADGDKIQVGAPAVEGISVSGKILEHLKGDKVIVFKKKRRKGYKKRNGHRQYLTKVEITGFGKGGAKKAAPAAKKEEAPKAEPKAAAPKTEAKAAPKKAAPKAKAEGDDLTKIVGIGPVYAKQLVAAGYSTYASIAAITEKDVAIIDDIDGVNANKIESEDWIGQAKALMGK